MNQATAEYLGNTLTACTTAIVRAIMSNQPHDLTGTHIDELEDDIRTVYEKAFRDGFIK